MEFLQTSLTARLLTLFLLLAIVPLAVTGLLAYESGRQSIVSNVEAHLESVAILKEQEIDSWVHHLEHTITWLASSPQTTSGAAVLATHTAGDPQVLASHDALVAEFGRITDLEHVSPVFLVDSATGQIIASSDTSWEGQFRDTEPWFIHGKTVTYVSDIRHSLALGQPTMVIATPVKDDRGQLLGVLAGHANLEGLSEIMMERSGLGETGETYLVNTGNLLLTDLRFEPGVTFRKWAFTEGVNRALAGESGVGLYPDYREEPVIGSYRWLANRHMALLAEMDQAEAFAPIVALRNAVLQIGLAVALVVAGLTLLTARTITRPVHQLVVGAQEIGRGNLAHRIETGARDEIGQLAGAFNDMTANLSHSLGEAAHGQRTLLALSQAAQAVQRARTPEQVYRAIGDEVAGLGYHALIMHMAEDGRHVALVHHTFESPLLEAAEKLAGLSARDYRAEVRPGDHRYQVLIGGNTIFFEHMSEPMAAGLPKLARPVLTRVSAMLGIEQGIYAPLKMGADTQGMMIVTGTGLTEADVPAVTTFANQAAIALENARLYQELQRHAAQLEQRVATRTQELDQARRAALNMMADADDARRMAEQANEDLRREIAERIRAEEELKKYRDQLEELVEERTGELREAQERLIRQEKLAILGQLAGGVGHELRNPLGAIKNATYFLNMVLENPDLDTREMLEVLDKEVNTAEKIISGLLDYARARPPTRRKVDVNQVVRETLSRTSLPGAPRVEVVPQLDEDLPLILADPDQLSQVFGNIIRNGIQAMTTPSSPPQAGGKQGAQVGGKQGGLRLTITTALESPEWVTVSVADTGAGIPEENLEKIFEPLFTTRAKGIGLGLALVKTLVEGHGGTIRVESQVGEGSTFTVRLPLGTSTPAKGEA